VSLSSVALLTGPSGGIGSAIAAELAAHGATIALAYGRNAGPAETLAAEIVDRGGRAIAVDADMSTASGPDKLVELVEQKLGAVDVLIANAGTVASYEDVDAAMFDETLAVNLRAPYLPARRVLGGMTARQYSSCHSPATNIGRLREHELGSRPRTWRRTRSSPSPRRTTPAAWTPSSQPAGRPPALALSRVRGPARRARPAPRYEVATGLLAETLSALVLASREARRELGELVAVVDDPQHLQIRGCRVLPSALLCRLSRDPVPPPC
jgi:NAD(P)-dependent dehydrogenase (short-subunit alcohol dehydrogenase family)